jgi:glycosyltransferase involved in cell wall biosynthesis
MMTSKSEGWGLTVTEAQQMGVVPIAFNSYASLCDIITDGDNGLVIPECDAAQYVEKLLWLMSHVPERRRLAAQAIDSAHRYENSKIVELWHALFKQLKDEK